VDSYASFGQDNGNKNISSFFQTLEDQREEGCCYRKFRPEGGGGAGLSSGMVWWCFK
jgi:hypothetical protein